MNTKSIVVLLLLSPLLMRVLADDPVLPIFPDNWYDTQYLGLEIAAGSEIELKGAMYWQMDSDSGGFNRSAFVSSNKNVVSTMMDWDGKTYGEPAIYYHDSVMCEYFCPITMLENCNEAEAFCSYDQLNNAKYVGPATYNGTQCLEFRFDSYLGPISMANTELYIANSTTLRPVFRVMNLTPFGQFEGNITQIYGNWTAGTPPSDAWGVPGLNSCPEGDPDTQCSDDALIAKGVPAMFRPSYWKRLMSKLRR